MGPPSSRSSAFPCGSPSITSKRTTSPRPFKAQRCASVPPIMPAPISAIFLRGMGLLPVSLTPSPSSHPRKASAGASRATGRRVEGSLGNIDEPYRGQPGGEGVEVVGVEMVEAEAEPLLPEVKVDLVHARLRALRSRCSVGALLPLHVTEGVGPYGAPVGDRPRPSARRSSCPASREAART